MPRRPPKRPRMWSQTRNGLTRFLWRFDGKIYPTPSYEDPEEARAEAVRQIDRQIEGTWRDARGGRVLLEDWVNQWWQGQDLEPTTDGNYMYLIEFHILPAFGRREIASLTYEEITAWERRIRATPSRTGRPYAAATASAARSRLITILQDAVDAGRIPINPAKRKQKRGRKKSAASSRSRAHAQRVATPSPATTILIAERAALLTGRDLDFIQVVWMGWTGMRFGEVLAVEASCFDFPDIGIPCYHLDWQLREIGGKVTKASPKDSSDRTVDLPPFLANLAETLVAGAWPCCCPERDGRPACKGGDTSPAAYVFLGPEAGHPRRSNWADRVLTPAATGAYPEHKGQRRPVYVNFQQPPGIPVRSTRKTKAADSADGAWEPLHAHVWPHLFRHAHDTWLNDAGVHELMRKDRIGHAMPGMDGTYLHVTPQSRRDCCEALEALFWDAVSSVGHESPVPTLSELQAQGRSRKTSASKNSAAQRPTRGQ